MSATKTSCRSIFNINLPEDYKLKHVFVPIEWKGLNAFYGDDVWSDGVNIYCSSSSTSQYILNKSNMTWETKRWSGSFAPVGANVWSDGINIFYSSGTTQYVLNNGTWEEKTWTYSPSAGSEIIQFQDKLYYLSGSGDFYVYNGSDFDYIDMTLVDWTVSISFIGSYLWTDGEKLYYSVRDKQYLMDLDSRQIVAMEWGDYEPKGYAIWSDGTNVYCDHPNPSMHHKLVNGVWVETEWNGLYGDFRGDFIWTDGENIYFSENGTNYIILPSTAQMYQHTTTGNTGWAKVGMTVTYPLPTEVSTRAEMDNMLETAEPGYIYKYIGNNDVYNKDSLYTVVLDSDVVSMTISGILYFAKDGMTWKEWVASEYNTAGYVNDGDYSNVKIDDVAYVARSNGTNIVGNEYIVMNENYIHKPL